MTKFSTRCVIIGLICLAFICLQYNFLFRVYFPHRVRTFRKPHPDALIIGVRKGGTRALLEALNLHEAVRIVRKETHFFDANYTLGTGWYAEQMPQVDAEEQIIIEKTPGYFTSKNAPKRVHQLNPKMKIILIVRHPVFRTISDFTQVYYNKLEQNKTLPILSIESFKIDEKSGKEVINLDYKPVSNSLYDVHFENWLKYFDLSQMHIVNGDVFRANPLNELRRLETFLQLPRQIQASQLHFDRKKGFFCFENLKKSSKIHCLGQSKGRKHREVSEKTQKKLADFFRFHNFQFFRLVNRTFSWDL
ncbi:unnamed protein product [Caenorhabditis angaria]|uniref:Sulfotransferase domain-containing protein n=1 Tax=Caenorhabditis angaria TaxID=860376 RepID=A0A9P1IEV7_9PELO|nr:unnamed protein product [Caenorhabditis angaria]